MTPEPAHDPETDGLAPVLVSVLTPVLNEDQELDQVLRRFREQADPGGEIEFLFADGGSTDRTCEILNAAARDDPRIVVLDNPRRITPSGLNVGLAVARGEFIARMDAHAIYPADYLRQGVQRLQAGGVEAVSGPQVATGRDTWSHRVATALGTRLGVGGSNFRSPIAEEVETDSGFTGLWRHSTIARYGGWDELAYPNEDTELASRIREDGGRLLLLPGMAAAYTPRNSLRALWKQYWRYGRGRGRTARMHPISIRRSHALCPGLVLALLGAVTPVAAPRRAARAGLGVYVGALVATAAPARPRRDAPYVPLVLVVLHISYGIGYLIGIITKRPAVRPAA